MAEVSAGGGTALDEFCPPHLRRAARQLTPLLYADLKRLARSERSRHISPQTLNTTALVHEAFLRLSTAPEFESHAHFLRVAAITMRHLLVDRARAQLSAKRGGGLTRADWSEAEDFQVEQGDWVLALHEALQRLARVSPRMAEVVECRVFSGYDDAQIAEALEISVRTVQRDWTMARAWLRREVGDAGLAPG